MTRTDEYYFTKARNVSTCSDFHKTHIGCIAVYQRHVIAVGYNTNKTHPIQQHYNKYRENNNIGCFAAKLHAEINCLNSIRHLDINFSKVKLYMYRSRCDQEYGMSRPCPSCMAAIKDLGIKHIYYTTNDGYGYEYIEGGGWLKTMRLCCPYCHGVGYHKVGCPEYEPAQSSYMCCECNERINIGDEYIKNDNNEYMHYDCIPEDRQFVEWLGYEIKEMEERDDKQTQI